MDFILKHWKLGLKVAGFVFLILAARGFQAEREARIRLEGELAAQQQVIRAQNQVLLEADRAIAQRDEMVTEQRAAIEKLKARPATVREIVREIPRFIPMNSPPVLFIAETQRDEGIRKEMPSAELGDSAVPSDSLLFDAQAANDLRKFYLECSQRGVELAACQEDLGDFRRKEEALKLKVLATEAQRDAALRSIKGGSFWHRLKHDAKTLAIGAAAGAVVAVVATR